MQAYASPVTTNKRILQALEELTLTNLALDNTCHAAVKARNEGMNDAASPARSCHTAEHIAKGPALPLNYQAIKEWATATSTNVAEVNHSDAKVACHDRSEHLPNCTVIDAITDGLGTDAGLSETHVNPTKLGDPYCWKYRPATTPL